LRGVAPSCRCRCCGTCPVQVRGPSDATRRSDFRCVAGGRWRTACRIQHPARWCSRSRVRVYITLNRTIATRTTHQAIEQSR
jgi:hypothetical protein